MGLTLPESLALCLCSGTELGGAYITGSTLQRCCPATFSTPAVGTQLFLLHGLPARQGPAPAAPSEETAAAPASSGTASQDSSTAAARAAIRPGAASAGQPGATQLPPSTGSTAASPLLSPHSRFAQPAVGEVALAAPLLGGSQRLLNKDHFQVGVARIVGQKVLRTRWTTSRWGVTGIVGQEVLEGSEDQVQFS
jgi:hypothetical protein